ncbi:hypothetical protein D9619_005087 [Psilocybe cf. subviscida]|uniref:Uncharacterized protein n=1 Tax=Psilocybe cf. subviscida TaxID=2480587 RepID=A0A8H5F823_9AGAR|nr:hypothetical protein D9619_005087 [Psilocybe cf. subviscida]
MYPYSNYPVFLNTHLCSAIEQQRRRILSGQPPNFGPLQSMVAPGDSFNAIVNMLLEFQWDAINSPGYQPFWLSTPSPAPSPIVPLSVTSAASTSWISSPSPSPLDSISSTNVELGCPSMTLSDNDAASTTPALSSSPNPSSGISPSASSTAPLTPPCIPPPSPAEWHHGFNHDQNAKNTPSPLAGVDEAVIDLNAHALNAYINPQQLAIQPDQVDLRRKEITNHVFKSVLPAAGRQLHHSQVQHTAEQYASRERGESVSERRGGATDHSTHGSKDKSRANKPAKKRTPYDAGSRGRGKGKAVAKTVVKARGRGAMAGQSVSTSGPQPLTALEDVRHYHPGHKRHKFTFVPKVRVFKDGEETGTVDHRPAGSNTVVVEAVDCPPIKLRKGGIQFRAMYEHAAS